MSIKKPHYYIPEERDYYHVECVGLVNDIDEFNKRGYFHLGFSMQSNKEYKCVVCGKDLNVDLDDIDKDRYKLCENCAIDFMSIRP